MSYPEDSIEFLDGDWMILKSVRPFGIGFNVYRGVPQEDGKVLFTKQNDRLSCFTSLEAAQKWLQQEKQK